MESPPEYNYASDNIGDSADPPPPQQTWESSLDVSHWGDGAWSNHRSQSRQVLEAPAPTASRGSPTTPIRLMHGMNLNAPTDFNDHRHGNSHPTSETPPHAGGGVGSLQQQSPAKCSKQSPKPFTAPKVRILAAGGQGATAPLSRTSGPAGSGQAGCPHLLSSSDTSSFDRKRLNRNTGQRRHSNTGHQLMADVTAETGEKMVKPPQDMTDAT